MGRRKPVKPVPVQPVRSATQPVSPEPKLARPVAVPPSTESLEVSLCICHTWSCVRILPSVILVKRLSSVRKTGYLNTFLVKVLWCKPYFWDSINLSVIVWVGVKYVIH